MKSGDIIIRSLETGDDVESWTRIHNQRQVAAGTLRIPFETQDFWRKRFVAGRMTRVLLAEIGGQVVGCAGFEVQGGADRHKGSLGMGVDENFQGRGVGSALLSAIVDLADNWYNLRRMELEVYADNAAGIALYSKFGFEVEGVYRKFAYREGAYVDALAMARLRQDPWNASRDEEDASNE